jgi:hypothetical protein
MTRQLPSLLTKFDQPSIFSCIPRTIRRRWRETHLLDVVVAESSAIFQLLAGEDQALLVWWDAFLVLDLGLHIVDGVAGLDLESDGLAREGFDEATMVD